MLVGEYRMTQHSARRQDAYGAQVKAGILIGYWDETEVAVARGSFDSG